MELKTYLDEAFSLNLLLGASARATQTRGKLFSANKTIDGNPKTYWATDDHVLNASIELDFGQPKKINTLLVQEYITLGQRVKSFSIEAQIDDKFEQIATGVTIGNRRIVKFNTITTQKLKINISAKASPLISNLEVYFVPELSRKLK